jgi:hypothetical protein
MFPEFKSVIEFILDPKPNPFAFRGLQPNLAQFFYIVIWVVKFETQELIYKLVRGSHAFSLALIGYHRVLLTKLVKNKQINHTPFLTSVTCVICQVNSLEVTHYPKIPRKSMRRRGGGRFVGRSR